MLNWQGTAEELEKALSENVVQATSNGMLAVGLIALEELLRKNRKNVLVRYNGGPSTRVFPLELWIVEGEYPVRAKLLL